MFQYIRDNLTVL